MITVQQLIEELFKVNDKRNEVVIYHEGERYEISEVDTTVKGSIELNTKMSRNRMLKDLVYDELAWFLENGNEGDNFQNSVHFFLNGGFNKLSDSDLEKQWKERIGKIP